DPRLERQLAAALDRSSQALEHGLVAPGSSPSARPERHEDARRLAGALGRLPAGCRDGLRLRPFRGFTFPEIAARRGKTPHGVKNVGLRGRARLRRALEDEA